ncbi:MAG: hypothetical protein WDO19_22950 [Bacteroidota bacterium]
MKLFYLLFLSILFLPVNVDSQTYFQLRDSASKYRDAKDYNTAFRLLSQGIAVAADHPFHNDLYDAASLASLVQLYDTAFYYLYRLLDAKEYDMISCEARNDADFKNLQNDKRWWPLIGKTGKMKINEDIRKFSAIAACVSYQQRLRFYSDSVLASKITQQQSGEQLFHLLNHYSQYPVINRKSKHELVQFASMINDSTTSFYEVQLPYNYNPSVSYPLLLVLHGAVFMNASFGDPRSNREYGAFDTTGMNQFFSQYGFRNNTIVVYPHANAEFNWMFPDDGFPMILSMVKDLKRYFNTDDNRVFISGHSNGATGAISYLLKAPSFFAGFYGFNSNPRIRTGGTFIKNALNRSYFNEATDKDYYFPVSGHDTLTRITTALGIDWQNHVYNGFPHWFPQFKESEPAFGLMFADMHKRTRNPFQPELYWECDDTRHGQCDWLCINKLDTTAEKKDWHTEINFPVTHWIDNQDTGKVSDTIIAAFNFPRLSGAIHARYTNNRFDIDASRVSDFSLFLSPLMIDFTKPVLVFVNGKKAVEKKVNFDKQFMLQSFRENFDRKAIWVNYIRVQL